MRKLAEQAQEYLSDGERIVAIQPVRNKGSLDAQASGGAIGTVVGARGSDREREAAVNAGVELGAFMALAITTERLLVFAVGGVARIDRLLSEVPLAEVDSITVDKVMLGTRKRITATVRGVPFALEAPGRQRAEELADALERARGVAA